MAAGGIYPPLAGEDMWATFIDQPMIALNTGWILDQTGTNATGVLSTNATWASTTTFTVPTDVTTNYSVGRRMKIIHAGGTTYCEVSSSSFAAGNTTVTITNVSSGPTTLTSAITSVSLGPSTTGVTGNTAQHHTLHGVGGYDDLGDATTPAASAVGDAGTVGTATTFAKRDHKHPREAFATNAVLLGTAAAAGAASTLMRSNDTIAAFDATNPTTQALGDSPVVGVINFAARRDHKHGMPPAIDVQVFTANGTWTKPSGSPKWVFVIVIGGGGGGAGGNGAGGWAGGGGGGGAYTSQMFDPSAFGATVSVTVGAAGTAGTAGANAGGAGGMSQFSILQAYGGGGGSNPGASYPSGGGGGGLTSVGAVGGTGAGGVGGGPHIFQALSSTADQGYGEGGTGGSRNVGNGLVIPAHCSWDGGGGGGGYTASTDTPGGSSMFGGGAGGGGCSSGAGSAGGANGSFVVGGGGASASAGTSRGGTGRAGDGGGGGASGATAGGGGGVPGGGGGGGGAGVTNVAGGAGARGEVIVYTGF